MKQNKKNQEKEEEDSYGDYVLFIVSPKPQS